MKLQKVRFKSSKNPFHSSSLDQLSKDFHNNRQCHYKNLSQLFSTMSILQLVKTSRLTKDQRVSTHNQAVILNSSKFMSTSLFLDRGITSRK
jgi:hypothetical protein